MSLIYEHGEVNRQLLKAITDEIKSAFPIKGKDKSLHVGEITLGKEKDPDNTAQQLDAVKHGRSWTVPLKAKLTLRDNDGKAVDEADITIAHFPPLTKLYTHIVKGTDYQSMYQLRLKSGVYTRVKANGELETDFNLAKGRGFKVTFDPSDGGFYLQYGTSNISLYPIMRAMDVSEEDLKKAWGKELVAINSKKNPRNELHKFYRAATGNRGTDKEALDFPKSLFAITELRTDTTKLTLGEPFGSVTGKALLAVSSKLLNVSRGKSEPDNRDALQFAELLNTADMLGDRIKAYIPSITNKVRYNIDRKDKITDIFNPSYFTDPIQTFFTSTSMTEPAKASNPLALLTGHARTTRLGPGGVSTPYQITEDARMSDTSHIGILDSVVTPESSRVGITLNLSIGAGKKGREATAAVVDRKTNELVHLTAGEMSDNVIAFHDQFTEKDGKFTPISDKVKAVNKGQYDLVSPSSVNFIFPSGRSMFSMLANLVPFLQSNQGGKVSVAARQMEQALPLKFREIPLVQTRSGDEEFTTFEHMLGNYLNPTSEVSGTVSSIDNISIEVTDKDGKKHLSYMYDNYPMGDKSSVLNSYPLVKKGDTVKKGQLLADNSVTRDGTLALGVNLLTAYMPYQHNTFEDAVVISEDAAKKLTSLHLYPTVQPTETGMVRSLKKFRSTYPDRITDEQAKKLDIDGVVKEGQVINPGDTIIAALRETEPSREELILKGIHRTLVKPYEDAGVTWDKSTSGRVESVTKNGFVRVHITTEEPCEVGDKLSIRYGNKGIISLILPQDQMPQVDGKPLEVILNPSTVPARMLVGQILEGAMGRIAEKKGEPVAIGNFETNSSKRIIYVKGHYRTVMTGPGRKIPKKVWVSGYDYTRDVSELMKQEGLSDTETVYDPVTKSNIENVNIGKNYILKLVHQGEKKLSARSYGAEVEYDVHMSPKGGGTTGAQALGELGMFSLLAHGSLHHLRDAQTFLSDRTQGEIWTAIQAGDAIPPPRPSFAYDKFVSYLNAMGINVRKEGSSLLALPLTDKDVLEMSNGKLDHPDLSLRAKDLRPEKGGLFDEDVTGGLTGSHTSHIPLSEPVPNPLFEKAVRALTGLNAEDFTGLVQGELEYDPVTGKIGKAEEMDGISGGPAIAQMLKKIDRDKELDNAMETARTATGNKLDNAIKKIKYLRALKKENLDPSVYMLNNVLVLPPIYRPITMLPNGDLNYDDLNGIYKGVAELNMQLATFPPELPEGEKAELRAGMYDAVKSLYGLSGTMNREYSGIMDIIHGPELKRGFFQNKLLKRKQDLSARGVIIPDAGLGLDEVGIPEEVMYTVYEPFLIRQLVTQGLTPLAAKEEVKNKTDRARKALEMEAESRPVLMKRDPALHKYSIQAFYPRLISGKSFKIHPLVTAGFNADFDGNCIIGSSKILLIFDTHDGKISSLDKLNEEYDMSFDPNTRIIFKKDYAIAETYIKNVPFLPDTARVGKDSAIIHDVPPGIKTWSRNTQGGSEWSDVTGFSIEFAKRCIEVITKHGHSVVASDNESLCVYDTASGKLVKARPEDSIGRICPVLRRVPSYGEDIDDFGEIFSMFVDKTLKDDHDIVPVPENIITICASTKSPCDSSTRKSLATIKSSKAPNYTISRELARKVLACLPLAGEWANIVEDTDTHWDIIKEVKDAGEHDVFDLVIPSTKVFALSSGLVVYDTMSLYVPATPEAVADARAMLPSANLINPMTNKLMFLPRIESLLGLHVLAEWGKKTDKTYNSEVAALEALKKNEIDYTDVIKVRNALTTAGRLTLSNILPEGMDTSDLRTDPKFILDQKSIHAIMHKMGTAYPSKYPEAVEKLTRLGFETIHKKGVSFSLKDFHALSEMRNKVLAEADEKISRITGPDRDDKIVDIYSDAIEKMDTEAKKVLKESGNNLYLLQSMGFKPEWNQVRQILIAPILLSNPRGETIPIPVTKSYGEGLDMGDYWIASIGARSGIIRKVHSVTDPGAVSKQIMHSVMNNRITVDDCGTMEGVRLPVDVDAVDRYLAGPMALKDHTLKANTPVTPETLALLRKNKKTTVLVRSPLKCKSKDGICQKCFGMWTGGQGAPIGTNIGILAGQALGERATQLSLKAFHSAGAKGSEGKLLSSFGRVKDLLKMPETLAGSCTLAKNSGIITRIANSPAGGKDVFIEGERHYVPQDRMLTVSVGKKMEKGQPLSSGPVNPHEMLPLTGISAVQNYITDELQKIYSSEGIRRRTLETVVKSLTDLSIVTRSGSHPEWLKGDIVPTSEIIYYNKSKPEKKVEANPTLKGIEILPLVMQTDFLARMAYRRPTDTVTRMAAEGWKSNLKSTHPIPAMVYGAEINEAEGGGK